MTFYPFDSAPDREEIMADMANDREKGDFEFMNLGLVIDVISPSVNSEKTVINVEMPAVNTDAHPFEKE